jgi:hypothetical protein
MARVVKLYCAGCGSPRSLSRFGINEDFEFDAAQRPAYELRLRIDEIGGRGRLVVDREPMPLPAARALRASMAEALAQLDAEIEGAEAGG